MITKNGTSEQKIQVIYIYIERERETERERERQPSAQGSHLMGFGGKLDVHNLTPRKGEGVSMI